MLSSRLRLLSLLGLTALTAAPAAARPPVRALHCGDRIAHDTTLAHSLLGCRGTGLAIVANGVTLDLGGHTVAGTNAPHGDGIAVEGHSGVTIRNGTVRGFRRNGVSFVKAPGGTVRHLTIRRIGAGGKEGEDVSAGIFAMRSSGLRLDHDDVSNRVRAFQADGVVLIRSPRARIAHIDSSRNAYNGIVLDQSGHSTVTASRTIANGSSGIFAASSPALTITANRSEGQNHDGFIAGILVLQSAGGRIAGNTVVGNTRGIDLENGVTRTAVTGNTVRGGGDGILLIGSDDNRVARNTVKDVRGAGVIVDGMDTTISDRNTVEAVTVTGAGDVGFVVVGGSTATVLRQDRALRNAGDGFHVEAVGTQLAGDVANRNGGHGISAVAGTVDGGGNTATGNRLSPQCSGVAC